MVPVKICQLMGRQTMVRRTLFLVALVLAIIMPTGSAVAATVSEQSHTQAVPCTTYQYEFVEDASVRDAPGGNQIGWIDHDSHDLEYGFYVINAHAGTVSWVAGRIYLTEGAGGHSVFIIEGWVLLQHLKYLLCW
jgi:hypothetical protein